MCELCDVMKNDDDDDGAGDDDAHTVQHCTSAVRAAGPRKCVLSFPSLLLVLVMVCVCDVASFIIISPVGPLSLSLCSCDASFDRPVQFSPWQTVTLAHSLSLIGFH